MFAKNARIRSRGRFNRICQTLFEQILCSAGREDVSRVYRAKESDVVRWALLRSRVRGRAGLKGEETVGSRQARLEFSSFSLCTMVRGQAEGPSQILW